MGSGGMTFLRGNDGRWVPASVDSRPRLRGGRLFAGRTGWCAGVTRGGLGPCGFLALWIPAFAGMTGWGAGMTGWGAGMTFLRGGDRVRWVGCMG